MRTLTPRAHSPPAAQLLLVVPGGAAGQRKRGGASDVPTHTRAERQRVQQSVFAPGAKPDGALRHR